MNDPDEKKWFMDILKRELGAEDGQLLRDKYTGTDICVRAAVIRAARFDIFPQVGRF